MKRNILVITLSLFITACGSHSTNSNNADTSAKKSAIVQILADTAGLSSKANSLIAGTDCAACHKQDVRTVGPSYKEIANKYTNANIDKLTDKVINGGGGVWGGANMPPHPAIKTEDAKVIVQYILAQK